MLARTRVESAVPGLDLGPPTGPPIEWPRADAGRAEDGRPPLWHALADAARPESGTAGFTPGRSHEVAPLVVL